MQNTQNDLTQGSILKKMLLFALPLFLGNVFQQLYNTVDSLIVGNFLGDLPLAAVSSSGNLIHLFIGFFQGLAMGAGILIAKHYGAREYEPMQRTIHTGVALGLCTGAVLTAVGIIMTPTILVWMDTPNDVLPYSISYFRLYFCGALFTVMYNMFVGILHAVGDSRHPLYYLIISSLVNVVLDLVLVGICRLGVGAAALATTVSQGISAMLCCIRLVRFDTPYRLFLKKIRFHWQSLKDIISFGIPSAVANSVIGFANVFVQSNINAFGSAAMAGCGAYSKLEGFAFLPVTCFTQALSTFVGQNLGAKQYHRAKQGAIFGTFCSVVIAEIIGFILYAAAPVLIRLFDDTPQVIAFGTLHTRTIARFFFLLAFSHCAAAILRGSGRPGVPMLVMLQFWCILRVSYITIAVQYVNELTTVSWAYPITWTCSSIVLLIYLLRADWLHNFDRIEQKKRV